MSKFNLFTDDEIKKDVVGADCLRVQSIRNADIPPHLDSLIDDGIRALRSEPISIHSTPAQFGSMQMPPPVPGIFYDMHVGPGSSLVDPRTRRYSLGVQGDSVFNGSETVNGPLHVNGPIDANGDLDVNGDLHINGALDILGQRISSDQLRRLLELIS